MSSPFKHAEVRADLERLGSLTEQDFHQALVAPRGFVVQREYPPDSPLVCVTFACEGMSGLPSPDSPLNTIGRVTLRDLVVVPLGGKEFHNLPTLTIDVWHAVYRVPDSQHVSLDELEKSGQVSHVKPHGIERYLIGVSRDDGKRSDGLRLCVGEDGIFTSGIIGNGLSLTPRCLDQLAADLSQLGTPSYVQ